MKQYYYTNGSEKFGPYTLDELKTKEISANTLVWYEGMKDWTAASQVEELSSMFSNTPPPAPIANPMTGQEKPNYPPKTWLVESILVTLFCCLPFGVVGIVHASKVESQFNYGNYEAAKKASEDAAKWTKIGFWIGLIVLLLYIIFIAVVGVGAGMANEF